MGRYIDDILQPGEKVLYSTTLHWIFYWTGDRRMDPRPRPSGAVAHDGYRGVVLLACRQRPLVIAVAAVYWT